MPLPGFLELFQESLITRSPTCSSAPGKSFYAWILSFWSFYRVSCWVLNILLVTTHCMVYFTTWVETVVLKPSSRSLLLLNFLECLRLIRRTVAFTLVNTGFNYVEIKRCVFNGELRMSEKDVRGWNKSKSCPDGEGEGTLSRCVGQVLLSVIIDFIVSWCSAVAQWRLVMWQSSPTANDARVRLPSSTCCCVVQNLIARGMTSRHYSNYRSLCEK